MITCNSLTKAYRGKTIIEESNLIIRDNKISFVMGPNGSGKTTFIKCLFGMEHYNGTIKFDNKNVDKVRESCLVLWDDCPFYTNLSGLDNLIILSEKSISKKEIIDISLPYMNTELLKSKVKNYSYGQKKKLALILIHILSPKYLVMDEISNGLDYDTMELLKKVIKDLSKSTTIILTGHQFEFYNDLVDDIFIFQKKAIVLYEKDISNKGLRLEDIYNEKMH